MLTKRCFDPYSTLGRPLPPGLKDHSSIQGGWSDHPSLFQGVEKPCLSHLVNRSGKQLTTRSPFLMTQSTDVWSQMIGILRVRMREYVYTMMLRWMDPLFRKSKGQRKPHESGPRWRIHLLIWSSCDLHRGHWMGRKAP